MKSLFVWPFLIKLSQTLSCNGRGGSLFFFGPQELGIASATLLHAPRRPSNVQNGHITPCSQRPDLILESLARLTRLLDDFSSNDGLLSADSDFSDLVRMRRYVLHL